MKNIKFILLVVVIGVSTVANAQFKFGVGGGMNISKQSGDVFENNELFGFNAGFISEIKLPTKLGFELDVHYSVKGASFDIFFNTDRAVKKKLAYIDFPVLAKFYMVKIINLQLGPQMSYL